MASYGNDGLGEEIGSEHESGDSGNAPKLMEYRIHVPPHKSRQLDEHSFYQPSRRRRLLDFLKARPSIEWLKKLRVADPLAIFWRTVNQREEISLLVPSPAGVVRRGFQIHFIRKVNWGSMLEICTNWLKHPMNIALALWLICVASSATMLGLILLGVLNKVFPTSALRHHWVEINNQILNMLFTLMSLYQHPILFYHLFMLCRWRSEDIVELRKIYCKNAVHRPREWAHMMVVIVLLHITCFAQYIVCSLYWGFPRKTRPEFYEDFLFALGTASPVFAAIYSFYSPLGREYDSDSDEESQAGAGSGKQAKLGLENTQKVMVNKPEWVGGLFDCSEDITVGYLSFFCTCCVFGWNMERLGFGNMYVHIFTFLLLCLAPFWIFNITAMNIHDDVIGEAIGVAGVVLCVCGFVYGGFWRIQMRKRFKLPGNKLCCGSATMTDYFQWLFCWSCSLAQEVRTANFYDVEDETLYIRLMSDDLDTQALLCSLSPGGGASPLMSSDHCSSPALISNMVRSQICSVTQGECSSSMVVEELSAAGDLSMSPPIRPLIILDGLEDNSTIAPSTMSEYTAIDDYIAPLAKGEE